MDMGTKRDASVNLSDLENKENKKQNMSNLLDPIGKKEGDEVEHGLPTTKSGLPPENGSDGEATKVVNAKEFTKIKDDVRRLKAIARNQRDEIREGIMAITNKLGEMFIAHSATATSANFYGDFIEQVSARVIYGELKEKSRDRKLDDMEVEIQKTASRVVNVEKDVRENTQARKSNNLVLNGVPEREGEDCLSTATNYLKHIDPKFEKSSLVNAYRLGRKGGSTGKYRTLLVKFKDSVVKEEIIKRKGVLKSKKELSKFHCNEDLPPSKRKVRQEMREIVRYALKNGYPDAKTSGNKLQLGEKVFFEDELYLLPPDLHMTNIKTRPIGGHRVPERIFVSIELLSLYHQYAPKRVPMCRAGLLLPQSYDL